MKKIAVGLLLLNMCAISAMEKKKTLSNVRGSLYVILPVDKYWNTGMGGFFLVDALEKKGKLKIIAPDKCQGSVFFKNLFASVSEEALSEYQIDAKPGKIDDPKYYHLIHNLYPNIEPPKGLECLKKCANWDEGFREWYKQEQNEDW